MSDLKLSDGREVDIDLYKISQKEYRHWFINPDTPADDADAYMEKVTGLENVADLPQPDYALVAQKIVDKVLRPVSDPNSSSESSSTTKKDTKNQSD